MLEKIQLLNPDYQIQELNENFKDYGRVIPNKLVRESIDNSWFIAAGNEKKEASEADAASGQPCEPGCGWQGEYGAVQYDGDQYRAAGGRRCH